MKVLFINNNGAGFADYVEVGKKTTVTEFFKEKMGKDSNPADFLIRVNRDVVPANYVLREKDRISVTPTKIDGARIAA
jgi:sulfur carrier protein ThiS